MYGTPFEEQACNNLNLIHGHDKFPLSQEKWLLRQIWIFNIYKLTIFILKKKQIYLSRYNLIIRRDWTLKFFLYILNIERFVIKIFDLKNKNKTN